MRIGTILTATNANPLYTEFIPIFIESWNKILPGADICIVFVADYIPDNLKIYDKHLRLFKPIPNIHTAFIAQCIRLLYPRLITREEGVLITDMDILPMNRSYYVDPIQTISDNYFIAYRDVCLPNEIAICYNVALPSTWREMFGNEPTESMLQSWYGNTEYDGASDGKGWYTDQRILLTKFNSHSGPKTILNDNITKYNRLDRGSRNLFKNLNKLRRAVSSGAYSDYHCLRPYSDYKNINDLIVSYLPK